MKIKDLPCSERPRERMLHSGITNISNEELLAIILKCGTKNKSVKELACEVLKRLNSIHDLEKMHLNTFSDIKGLGKIKSMEIMASIELGKRIFLQKKQQVEIIYYCSKNIYEDNKNLFYHQKQECFYGLYVDSKKKLIERKLLFMGTLNRSLVHPREVFKEAYLTSASGIICMHNHPSGDIKPSMEDTYLTKSLIAIGKLQGIEIIDHLIIGNNDYYSFYDHQKDLFI